MRLFTTPGRKTMVAAAGLVAALGVGGTAYAATSTGSGAPAPAANSGATSPASAPHKGHARSLLRRADHATVELKVKGQWVTYTLDRGKVTAASSTSITLARPDGQSVTDTISASTKFAGVTSEAAVQLNRPATVLSQNGAAVRISQAKHAAQAPAGAGSKPAGSSS